MPSGHAIHHQPGLAQRRAASFSRPRASLARRRHPAVIPGLASASRLATVEEIVASEDDGNWMVWGCSDGRPILFVVEPRAGAEMSAAVAKGEIATAIVQRGQIVLERLD